MHFLPHIFSLMWQPLEQVLASLAAHRQPPGHVRA
jgi:hypothetical protein